MKKGYFCICMSKAVHVDLIVDLSTEAFLASLYLLVALHVAPSDLYNGSNFQRADVQELQRHFDLLESTSTQACLHLCTFIKYCR